MHCDTIFSYSFKTRRSFDIVFRAIQKTSFNANLNRIPVSEPLTKRSLGKTCTKKP